jgi:L-2-hydroxyglutarate oxidase LhgO
MTTEEPRQHGVRGVYFGGEWLDIEECGNTSTKFGPNVNPVLNDCDTCIKPCPRSRTRHTSAKQYVPSMNGLPSFEIYDIVIIGAGCIGATIARTLCQYNTNLSILWVEAADDVSQGATKGNSGIVHAGYDDKPGSVRAQHCWKGNQMFAQLDHELRFGYQKNGSLVLATNEKEIQELYNLYERGQTNGVQNLEVIKDVKRLKEMEPYISENVIGALYAPDAGNVIPYEFTIALAENAIDNGVELRIRTKVTKIEQHDRNTKYPFTVHVEYWEPADYVASKSKQLVGWYVKQGLFFIAFFACTLVGARVFAWHSGVITTHHNTNNNHHTTVENDMFLIGPSVVFIISMLLATIPNPLTRISPNVSKSTPISKFVGQAGLPVGGNTTKQVRPMNGTVQHDSVVPVNDMFVGGSGSSNTWYGRIVKDPVLTSISAKFSDENDKDNNEETTLRPRTNQIRCTYVINCAGGASDQIAAMIGDTSFHIKPRLGDYILLNRNQVRILFSTIVFVKNSIQSKHSIPSVCSIV